MPFLAAGLLSLLGALVHGGVGEARLLRHVRAEDLPRTRLGGPGTSLLLIRASWHLVTVTFVVLGAGLVVCGGTGGGASCVGVGRLSAVGFGAFAVLTLALPLWRPPRRLPRHPAPILFITIALLAWWGIGR